MRRGWDAEGSQLCPGLGTGAGGGAVPGAAGEPAGPAGGALLVGGPDGGTDGGAECAAPGPSSGPTPCRSGRVRGPGAASCGGASLFGPIPQPVCLFGGAGAVGTDRVFAFQLRADSGGDRERPGGRWSHPLPTAPAGSVSRRLRAGTGYPTAGAGACDGTG